MFQGEDLGHAGFFLRVNALSVRRYALVANLRGKLLESVIILAARNQLSVSNFNSQMSPIHGKPALFWIIDLYYKNQKVIVVINERNKLLKKYIEMTYPNVLCIIVQQDEMYKKYGQNSVLTSLSEGLQNLPPEENKIKIVLGDTYCNAINCDFKDFILTSDGAKTSEKWCLVKRNKEGCVSEFYDKKKNIDVVDKEIVAGFYCVSDVAELKKSLSDEIAANNNSMSSLIMSYNKKNPVHCVKTDSWFDFGHRGGILKAQKQFYNSRNFNSIIVNDVTNILTKRSVKKQKLSDEYLWYKEMPEGLQSFVPRVYQVRDTEELFEIDMENYGYPPLSELWLYGEYDLDLWQLITKKLVDIRLYMNNFSGTLERKNYEQLYVEKLFDRLSELKKIGSYWEKLLSEKYITVNDRKLNNLPAYENKLRAALEKIAETANTTVMHGDYCFSNILFDTQNFVCKLIDPRGRLLEQTIYGDSRYDFAKLRHSLVGNYDYIVHGAYFFVEENGAFTYKDGCLEDRTVLADYFDKLLESNGYDIKEIKLIEATLFLSMIPLHTDSFEQQKIFYIKGIQKLNECFGE